MRSHQGHSAADAAAASTCKPPACAGFWRAAFQSRSAKFKLFKIKKFRKLSATLPFIFRDKKGAGLLDSCSVGSVMHPCAQRLWMPVLCSQTKPAKICSVNFRPFSAHKERSEFETVPCPQKSLHSLYARPRHPNPTRQGYRLSGLAFRRFRDASMRAAPMDAGAMFPNKARKNLFRELPSVQCPQRAQRI